MSVATDTHASTTGRGVMAPLVVDDLSKRFGSRDAVSNVSFELTAGSVTGFLGPNGAGKTTTLRVVGGLLRPSSGVVRLFGEPSDHASARRRLGYMPADPSFLPRLSGLDNLDLLARLRGTGAVSDRDKAASALSLTDADLRRPVGGYSSGMRQKLAIVAALQHRPDLVVLDEPANRLDPLAHRAFCRLVRQVAADGRTVLLSSHVLAEVEEACDTVVMLRAGRLLGTASVDELRRRSSRQVTVTYRVAPARLPDDAPGLHLDGAVASGRIPAQRPDLLRSLLADPMVVDLTVSPASLEDVFIDLYAGADR